MKIVVQGLWHLGLVTAACLSEIGYETVGIGEDEEMVAAIKSGCLPIFEPGLAELIGNSIAKNKLSFTTDCKEALKNASVLWVAFDTPVNDVDDADSDHVLNQVIELMPFVLPGCVVIVSSQLPVGSIAKLENHAQEFWPKKELLFACIPENLRLGQSLDIFRNPDRFIVGVKEYRAKKFIQDLLSPFNASIVYMSIESAEMTKHAINAFLATSITFANEIAGICEKVGADANEVARGLKTESRIGPGAYVSPGPPYSGGTLARDIKFLNRICMDRLVYAPLLSSVQKSNDAHKKWIENKFLELFPDLREIKVGIWGLTYKPNTDTLRRSLSVELCKWLSSYGAVVKVFDPVVKDLPPDLKALHILNCQNALEAVSNVDVLVIGTNWPQFIAEAKLLNSPSFQGLIVFDATSFVASSLTAAEITCISIGRHKSLTPKL